MCSYCEFHVEGFKRTQVTVKMVANHHFPGFNCNFLLCPEWLLLKMNNYVPLKFMPHISTTELVKSWGYLLSMGGYRFSYSWSLACYRRILVYRCTLYPTGLHCYSMAVIYRLRQPNTVMYFPNSTVINI